MKIGEIDHPRSSPSGRLRIIVLGYIIRGPLGGLAWHHLQYVMGLRQLGHDVYFVEDSDDYPCCYDPTTSSMTVDASYGLRFATETFDRVGLGDRWAYYDAHTAHWRGPCAERILEVCDTADLLLHMSGKNRLRSWLLQVPVKALVDTDPVFTQVRHLTDGPARARALKHDVFFSFGENIGRPDSAVPSDGLPWKSTRQPIVLDAWPVTPGPAAGKWTTVMQWDSYPACEYDGVHYGMKSDSFEPYLDLPGKTGDGFEIAVGSPTAPKQLLRDRGWLVCNPLQTTRTPWTYQQYIQRSKAEFTVAKHGYVVSRSGWFSERSAAYLASGRPVLTQDTGFSGWLPTGVGLVAFGTPGEALAGLEQINRHYESHCQSAREIASAHFDARQVLSRLIDDALNSDAGLLRKSEDRSSCPS